MQTRVHRHPPLPLPARLAVFGRAASALAAALLLGLRRWQETARQRRALLELDDHLLKDIGLRREDALREADRMLREDLLGGRPWW